MPSVAAILLPPISDNVVALLTPLLNGESGEVLSWSGSSAANNETVIRGGTLRALFERLFPLRYSVTNDEPLRRFCAEFCATLRSPTEALLLLTAIHERYFSPMQRFESNVEKIERKQRRVLALHARFNVVRVLRIWIHVAGRDLSSPLFSDVFDQLCRFLLPHPAPADEARRVKTMPRAGSGKSSSLSRSQVKRRQAAKRPQTMSGTSSRSRADMSRSPERLAQSARLKRSSGEHRKNRNRSLSQSSGSVASKRHRHHSSESSTLSSSSSSSSSSSTNTSGNNNTLKRRSSEQKQLMENLHKIVSDMKVNLLIDLQKNSLTRPVRINGKVKIDLLGKIVVAAVHSGSLSCTVSELNERVVTGAALVAWLDRALLYDDSETTARGLASRLYDAGHVRPHGATHGVFVQRDDALYNVPAATTPPSPVPLQPTQKHLRNANSMLSSVLDYHPIEVARQLTLMAHDEIRAIGLYDFDKREEAIASKRRADAEAEEQSGSGSSSGSELQRVMAGESDPLLRAIGGFNSIARWVSGEVVRETNSMPRRVAIIKRLIAIAYECRRLQNWHGATAIHLGLNQHAVARLKMSWAALSAKWRRRLDELDEIVTPLNNAAQLRLAVAQSDAPFVPPLHLVLRDLTILAEQPKFVDPSTAAPLPHEEEQLPDEPPLAATVPAAWAVTFARTYNWQRARLEAAALLGFARAREGRYAFRPISSIQNYIRATSHLGDRHVALLSKVAEGSPLSQTTRAVSDSSSDVPTTNPLVKSAPSPPKSRNPAALEKEKSRRRSSH